MSTSDADKPPIHVPVAQPVDAVDSEPNAQALDVRYVPFRGERLLHWTFLLMSIMIVIASFALRVHDNGEQVILPIVGKALPGTCTFRRVSGIPCPGCGLTRSFISMGHGRLGEAWSFNPAGFFFFAIVAFQIPYRIFQLSRIRRGLGSHRFVQLDSWILIALVVILFIQWFYGLLF